MADNRENILTRLVAVCGAVEGIAAVARNRLDVPALKRPAVLVQDGAEQLLDAPQPPQRGPVQRVQRLDLTPLVIVIVRGSDGIDAGSLLTLYRNRIVAAVLSDSLLVGYVGSSGGMRYEAASVAAPDAESKEFRIELSFVFTYTFRLSELLAA